MCSDKRRYVIKRPTERDKRAAHSMCVMHVPDAAAAPLAVQSTVTAQVSENGKMCSFREQIINNFYQLRPVLSSRSFQLQDNNQQRE